MRLTDTLAPLLDKARGFNGTGDPYMDQLFEQQLAKEMMDAIKPVELDLRLLCFNGAFPNPKEGTNTWKLPDGRELKGKHEVRRTIVEEAIKPVLDTLREQGCANTDVLIRWKPELSKSEWNSLSDEQKLLFSPAVIATPGTPQFEVVIPKKRGKAAA